MKKRIRKKIEKRSHQWIEIVEDGLVDVITRDRKLAEPRLVFQKGAKVFVYGAPEIQNGTSIVPVRAKMASGAMRKCWIETKFLNQDKLRSLLEKLGIRSAAWK